MKVNDWNNAMEDSYVKLSDFAGRLGLKKGDLVYVTSDVKELLYGCMHHDDDTDLNILIDAMIDIIGEEGSLVFPVFNWSFCKGETFDYNRTPGKTGSLGKIAMARSDFKRTQHPIYSFVVYGRYQQEMCAMTNESSFGSDSPFAFMVEKGYRNLFIDKDLQHSFVFVHYVEQSVGNLHAAYRYLKNFTADYIDAGGHVTRRTYSMNVRALDRDVENVIYAFEDEFIEKGIMQRFYVNELEIKLIELKDAYPIMAEDVRHNRSRRICTFIGQDNDYLEEGRGMFELCKRLFPICRSITGNGVRQTLAILKEYMPGMTIHEVPSGTSVFDWTVPNEWNITDAYLEGPEGVRIVDFKDSNLNVLGYSVPVDVTLPLNEMNEHIYTLKDQPELVPYTTSYYKERWGFAMSENRRRQLKDGDYHAVIKSELKPGSLTYGELIIPGESDEEIFFSSYICHPSMANNECSGPAVLAYIAKYLMGLKSRKYTYRLILVPETIGAITYLSKNLKELKEKVICGFNVTCVGDDRTYSIVHSRYGDTVADKLLTTVLEGMDGEYQDYSYLSRGSDERQYQAPGVDLPLVCFCRSKYHVYPEYHTSADNMDIISPDGLGGSYEVLKTCIDVLENNAKYKVTCYCEPQLGKRGLVPTMSSKETYRQTLILKDVLAYADGRNDLIDLARIIEKPIGQVLPVVEQLKKAGLIEAV